MISKQMSWLFWNSLMNGNANIDRNSVSPNIGDQWASDDSTLFTHTGSPTHYLTILKLFILRYYSLTACMLLAGHCKDTSPIQTSASTIYNDSLLISLVRSDLKPKVTLEKMHRFNKTKVTLVVLIIITVKATPEHIVTVVQSQS